MAEVTTTEKQILEKLFGMGSGSVLNFSNRTFSEFFRDDLKVDIYHPKYHYSSGSKANQMRGFWLVADDKLVARSIDQLITYIDAQIALGLLRAEDYSQDLIAKAGAISNRLTGRNMARQSPVPNMNLHGRSVVGATPDNHDAKGLEKQLFNLNDLPPQERGYAFERFLKIIFELHHLAPRNSFRLLGEQIDGSFLLGQDVYLVEAKWQSKLTGQTDLLAFSGKVEGKAQWSRGVFISYVGFSPDGLEAFGRGKPTRIVCMDGFDLHGVLRHQLSLSEVITMKMRSAAETNKAYVPVRELYPAISF